MTESFAKNKKMLGHVPDFGFVFEGDTYCIKHQELLTLGWGDDIPECGFCIWGDD